MRNHKTTLLCVTKHPHVSQQILKMSMMDIYYVSGSLELTFHFFASSHFWTVSLASEQCRWSILTPSLKSWRVRTWAFLGIIASSIHILWSAFWMTSPTASALSQLMSSEAINPVDKIFKWNSAKSKGSWQLNQSNNFCKSVL